MVNEGHAAGASLEHSHAQLYALDSVPAMVAREREHFTAHNTRTMGGCLLCDLLKEEVRRRERVVAVDDHAVLLAPFASRGPTSCSSCHATTSAASRSPIRRPSTSCATACRSCAPSSAARRRSTCGSGPRRAGPTTSTGTSTWCRA